ncbi:MAG: choice-of-anchor I family protein, partial [Pseudomonadota bacterium]
PEGGISQNDIATTLAFNNGLTLLDITKTEIKDFLEGAVSALPTGVSGGFPQISGLQFSFDETQTAQTYDVDGNILVAGQRVQNAGIFDADGTLIAEVVRNGEIVGEPTESFRVVTLNFLANAGDEILSNLSNPNRVDLIDLDADGVADEVFSGAATFAADGSEQDALAEYLNDNFNPANGGTAFSEADTGPDADSRIQNLTFREDTVLPDVAPPAPPQATGDLVATVVAQFEGDSGDPTDPEGASEVVVHEGGLLYVTNGASDRIDIFDIAGDALVNTIPLDGLDGYDGVQSVAVKNGLVAAAISRAPVEETSFGVTKPVEQPGFVALFDAASLKLITTVDVGNLPDQLTFNADGTSLLVAGEGQFNEDSIDSGVAVNPLGTVAIIDVTALVGANLPEAVIAYDSVTVDGLSDAAIFEHTGALELDSGTIALDLHLDDTEGRQTFMSKDARGYDTGGHITIWADAGTVKVRMQSEDASYYAIGGKLEANVDQSIAVTFGEGGLKLFVNGELESSKSYTGGLSGNTEPVVLGASQLWSSKGTTNRLHTPMDGTISSVAVYGEALSDEQIADLANSGAETPQLTADILDFTQFNGFEDAARDAGIRIQEGVDFADDVEPEYIAISPDGTTAFVALQENNAIAKIDLATNTVLDVFGLGVTDYSEVSLDPLDDGNIDIRTFDSLVGFRMPDAIATADIGGQTFVLTANEGDSRDFDEDRVFDLAQDGLIDPTVQQNLIDNGQLDLSDEDFGLGRLEVSSIDGNTDGDGDIDVLHTFSSRSFSIFDADGNLVFDSGSQFEEIIADLAPERFNDNDGADGENRSDAKGPEPEAIITGEVDGSIYAFIGLERDSGIMIYNIDDPANAFFVDYIPPLHVDNAGDGDVARHGPETIAFIPAEDSSTGNAQIAVAYEISGTTFVYDVRALDQSIMNIQGAGHVSAFEGQTVRTTGVVTAVDFNGYYLQDPDGDGDDATSDAIFVFVGNGNAGGIAVGDEVQVRGTVSEFIPGGAGTGNLSTTQISDFGASNSTVLSSGNALPDAVVIGAAGRTPPTEIVISDDELPVNLQDDPGVFNPETDGIDFYESLEAMRVVVDNPVAISATNRFDETWVVADDGAGTTPGLNGRGGLDINADADGFGDVNPERIQLQYDAFFDLLPEGFTPPALTVGDDLSDVTGVVSYSFGNFEVLVTDAFDVEAASSNVAEVTEIAAGDRDLTVATYNVLNVTSNFDSGDDDDADADQIAALAAQIVDNLGSPDILALQEIQDNSGVNFNAEDGVLEADETLQAIVDAIAAAGGPQYTAVSAVVDVEGETGGVPGGNIRNAFLYNEDRVTAVNIQTLEVDELNAFGVTDPNAFDGTRDPLLGTFEFNGEEITLINNHFSSRFGSTPIFGGPQPFVQAGEDAREREASTINEVVDALLADNSEANVVVLGDLNTFEFTDELTEDLPGVGDEQVLTNLSATADDSYTFNFQGNSQALDHIFVTEGLLEGAAVDVVHTNVDFTNATSDHEPIVASFFFAVPGDIVAGTDQGDILTGTGGDDQIFGERGGDQIFGFDGFDFVDAGRGRDVVFGGDGDDTILGGNGRDVLLGEEGEDNIDGGRGRDLIEGGADNDILTGGGEVDTFVFSGVFGDDIITDFEAIDELIFSGISTAELAIEANADGLVVTAMNEDIDGTVTLLGFNQVDFFA